jgi:GT2 family glycosyltransferase
VICCYTEDRLDDIVDAVRSVQGQEPEPEEIVLVVDHNEALATKLAGLVSGVTIIENAEARGLSGARNTAVHHAAAKVVAFLDDDATAAPGWIAGLESRYHDPTVIGAGGAAAPRWPVAAPRWFPEEFGWVVGCSYRGQPTRAAPVRNLIGCNMSLRHDVFERVGGFSSEVGRIGTLPVGCEETELCIRARQAFPGTEIIYDPDLWVAHRVSGERLRPRYFFRRCWSEGKSKAIVARLAGASEGLATERSYAIRVLPRGVVANIGAGLKGDPTGVARAGMIIAGLATTAAGYVVEVGRQQRRAGRSKGR